MRSWGGGGPDELPPPLKPRGAAPAQTGQAKLSAGAAVGGGGGVASLLTEVSYALRTFHGTRLMSTTDGVLFCRIRPLASIKMKDAAGATIDFEFKSPA